MRHTVMPAHRIARPLAVVAAAVTATAVLATPAMAADAPPVWGADPDVRAAAAQLSATVSWNRLGNSGPGADAGSPPVTSAGYRVVVRRSGVEVPGLGCATAPVNQARMWCRVNGLTAGVAYTFAVEATNGVASVVSPATAAPVTPYGVPKAAPVTARPGYELVSASWAGADGRGRPVTSYVAKLWRYGVRTPLVSRSLPASARSTVFAGLTAGAKYRVTVAAVTGTKAAPPVLVSPAPSSAYVVPTLPPATKLPLRLGQRGPLVYVLQQRLAWAGLPVHPTISRSSFTPTAANTLFDAATQRQVKHFQEKFLISQTGVVGEITWAKLKEVTASKGALPSGCQGTVVCVSKTQRILRYLVNGRIVKMTDVRFGPEDDPALRTRNGTHYIFSKDRYHVSTLYKTPMYYAMFFDGGQAIHFSKFFLADGYWGHSHGCVNVRDEAAVSWLFDNVAMGTKVYIY